MKKPHYSIAIVIALLLGSCSKNDDSPSPQGGGNSFPANYDPGVLFIKQGMEGITKFDLSTGTVSTVVPYWHDGHGWDIGWDGQKGVKEVNPSSYDTRYIIFDAEDGSTLKEIFYEPQDNNGGLPNISPDGTKLALRPTYRDGLVILDLNGNVLREVSGYGEGHEFRSFDPISWEPGGTLLFKRGSELWRTSADFGRAFKVRDIPLDDWKGDCNASRDGKKIVLSADNHIWLMNVDGSDFHAVTDSDQQEFSPVFSPDSKYIAMKANSRAPNAGDVAGNAFHICIIPADGQVYRVWPGEDDRVIHPMVKGSPDARGLGKTIVGDFEWR